MKARKLKTFLLGTTALAGVMFTSCGEAQPSDKEDREAPKQAQKYDIEKARKEYQNKCADSLRTVNGYSELFQQSGIVRDSLYAIRDAKLQNLKFETSLGGTMEKAVAKSGEKIVSRFFQDISTLLGKYKVSFNSYLGGEDEDYWYFHTNTQNHYRGMDNVFKMDLFFIGVLSEEEDYIRSDEEVKKIIEQIVDESEYGQMRKAEIMAQINTLIEQLKKQLIASRKAVEKEYSDYYVTIDGEDLALQHEAEGNIGYGYSHLNDACAVLIKHSGAKVYDSNLPVSFFGDKNAEYTLVSVGKDKWQVQKKTASGKIEKTAVFTDAGYVYEWVGIYGKDYEPGKHFYYEPGKNMGVHVEFSEHTVVKKARKEWTIPQSVVNEIGTLEEQVRQLEQRESELYYKMDKISHVSDSIAYEMASQKFKTR